MKKYLLSVCAALSLSAAGYATPIQAEYSGVVNYVSGSNPSVFVGDNYDVNLSFNTQDATAISGGSYGNWNETGYGFWANWTGNYGADAVNQTLWTRFYVHDGLNSNESDALIIRGAVAPGAGSDLISMEAYGSYLSFSGTSIDQIRLLGSLANHQSFWANDNEFAYAFSAQTVSVSVPETGIVGLILDL